MKRLLLLIAMTATFIFSTSFANSSLRMKLEEICLNSEPQFYEIVNITSPKKNTKKPIFIGKDSYVNLPGVNTGEVLQPQFRVNEYCSNVCADTTTKEQFGTPCVENCVEHLASYWENLNNKMPKTKAQENGIIKVSCDK